MSDQVRPSPWSRFRALPDAVRVSTYVAAGLALALVVAGLLAVALARRPLPQTGGELQVAGLSAAVQVVRDEHGVPHLFAETPEDLALAQGYVTAQERFFQMDVRRRSASGRLAELVGEGAVAGDVTARTLGLRQVAERELALLEPDTRTFLEAYTDGVNAYLDQVSPSQLAVEYTLLGLDGADRAPEDWSAVDSLTWLKAWAWDLDGAGAVADEVARVLAAEAVGADRAAQLWPAYPSDVVPVVPTGAVVDGAYEPQATRGGTRNPQRPAWGVGARAVGDAVTGAARALDRLPLWAGRGAGVGSNAWAVSGERTATGMPLLAADPHLAAEIPGPLMQVGLHCREVGPSCPWDAAGFALPGVPGVLQGHNGDLAWASAALGADTADLVVERLREDRFRYDGRWRPVRTDQVVVEVAGADDVEVTVRRTRHGPVLSDAAPEVAATGEASRPARAREEDEQVAVALTWSGLEPAPTLDAVLGLALADGVDGARQALARHAVPTQSVVLADTAGSIGVQVAGHVPVRKSGRTGTLPSAGWLPENDWTGEPVPAAGLPFTTDPEEGYVVAANQLPVAEPYPYPLGSAWDRGQRSGRIRFALDGDGAVDVAATEALQRDDLSALAPVLVPALLEVRLDPGYADDGQRLLEEWDLHQPAEGDGSAAAAYLNAVWRELLAATFDDELPEEARPDGGPRWHAVVAALLERPDDPWWDDVSTDVVESRDQVLRAALLEARDDLVRREAQDATRWTWGHQHRLELRSPGLVGDGPAPGLARRVVEPDAWEVGGGPGSVLATGWDAAEGYVVTTAPAARMVLDLSDWDASRWVALTGVSGHPFSDHYTDQTDLLVEGGSLPFPFTDAAVAAAEQETLTLLPPD